MGLGAPHMSWKFLLDMLIPNFLWRFEIFGPIGLNGNTKLEVIYKFWGTDIKNLFWGKQCNADFYWCGKFRNDMIMTMFRNIQVNIFKTGFTFTIDKHSDPY